MLITQRINVVESFGVRKGCLLEHCQIDRLSSQHDWPVYDAKKGKHGRVSSTPDTFVCITSHSLKQPSFICDPKEGQRGCRK